MRKKYLQNKNIFLCGEPCCWFEALTLCFFSWVFGQRQFQSLHSGAPMVVQLHCPDALKALPFLTGHENVPSAHFGHRALRTFNWTITHEEKKQIISPSYYPPPQEPQKAVWFQLFSLLRRRGFVCTRSPGGHDSSPDVLWMDLSLGHTQWLSARQSCFLVRRAACPGLQSPGNYNAAKQKSGAVFGLQPLPAAGLQLTAATTGNQEGCGFPTQQRAQAFPSRKSYQFSIFCVPFSTSISFF